VSHFNRAGVFSFVVDVMVTIVFNVFPYQALGIVMMLGLSRCKGGFCPQQ
jgi:hypothetical protein